MPRRQLAIEQPTRSNNDLAEKLSAELKARNESGQPLIYEQELGPEKLRVTVIWDEWDHLPLEERTSIILRAYELSGEVPSRSRIALASGLTVPEATAAGMLPYQVGTAWRKTDPVTLEECRKAMLAEGASTLFGPNILQLRFATLEEADNCRERLIQFLPNSKDVWIVSMEIAVQNTLDLEQRVEADSSSP